MTAADIAKALGGRRCGSGWKAPCVAHRDRSPSLSLRDADGKVLVHCFAGCSADDVIAALRSRGLWPESVKRSWTREERREYALNRSRAEKLAAEALHWHAARCVDLEKAKDSAYSKYLSCPNAQTETAWADASRGLFLAQQLSGAALAEAYRRAVKNDPAGVRKLILKSKQDIKHAERCTELVVDALAQGVGNEQQRGTARTD